MKMYRNDTASKYNEKSTWRNTQLYIFAYREPDHMTTHEFNENEN